jgi:hypothetical protein
MLEDLTAAAFEELVGTRFRIALGDGGILELVLSQVDRYEAHPGPRAEPFSALFHSPTEGRRFLSQQTYRLEHDRLGALEVFLVPLGPDAKGMRYEAVFN